MNDHRAEGRAREARGSVKEAIGKLTGDATTQGQGRDEKAAGKVQAQGGTQATRAGADRDSGTPSRT